MYLCDNSFLRKTQFQNKGEASPLGKPKVPKNLVGNDEIFSNLNKIKFDGLYRLYDQNQDINDDIELLLKELNQNSDEKHGNKNEIKTNKIDLSDNSYPFKQEKLRCLIL